MNINLIMGVLTILALYGFMWSLSLKSKKINETRMKKIPGAHWNDQKQNR